MILLDNLRLNYVEAMRDFLDGADVCCNDRGDYFYMPELRASYTDSGEIEEAAEYLVLDLEEIIDKRDYDAPLGRLTRSSIYMLIDFFEGMEFEWPDDDDDFDYCYIESYPVGMEKARQLSYALGEARNYFHDVIAERGYLTLPGAAA